MPEPDLILIERMQFYAYHGNNPEEQILGQRFEVDVALETSTRRAGRSDDLADTVNYSRVFQTVRGIVEGKPRRLLESVAETIASELLVAEPLANAVRITIRKPQAPLKGGVFGAAAVVIFRTREDFAS